MIYLKKSLLLVGVVGLSLSFSATPTQAAGLLEDSFNGGFDFSWHFLNFEEENGVSTRHPGVACGTDACASLEQEGSTEFLKVSIFPTINEGIYTNTDVSEVELGHSTSIESGPWNPQIGKPVIMTTKVRWSEGYSFDGSGGNVGTSGIILWNSAVDETGAMPEYDHIGFTWADNQVLMGLIGGFNATAILNQTPVGISKPLTPFNLNDWNELKMVWSTNLLGIQTVKYYVNNSLFGLQVLPVPLHNLSAEIWTDNQRPNLGLSGIEYTYPEPIRDQSFEVDWVRVEQQ